MGEIKNIKGQRRGAWIGGPGCGLGLSLTSLETKMLESRRRRRESLKVLPGVLGFVVQCL